MNLTLISLQGDVYQAQFPINQNVSDVKMAALTHFYGSSDDILCRDYRLIHVRHGEGISDSDTLSSIAINSGDELILIKQSTANKDSGKSQLSSDCEATESNSSNNASSMLPDMNAIQEATAHLTAHQKQSAPVMNQSELQSLVALRPVLVNLITSCQHILCLSKDAETIFHQVQRQLQNSENDLNTSVDEACVQKLVDMGFPSEQSRKALHLCNNILSQAMDWLFTHEGQTGAESGPTDQIQNPELTTLFQNESEFAQPMQPQRILQLYRAYNQSQFRANEAGKFQLMEMGFDEREVVKALRLSNNEQSNALDLLLNPRSLDDQSDEELVGISEDSPMWKAVCNDPVIQLGLTNPSVLFAFLDILDNPSAALRWINNMEVGAVLYQLSRIYDSDPMDAVANNL